MKNAVSMIMLLALLTLAVPGWAQTPAHEAAQAELDKRAQATGNVDVYDEKGKKVRHLKLIEMKPDVTEADGATVVQADFEDQYSKEVVTLEVRVTGEEVSSPVIAAVNKPAPVAVMNVTDMPQEELIAVIKKQLNERAEEDGRLVFFDPAIKGLRFMTFVDLVGEPRKYGKIAVMSAQYTDAERNQTVIMDATIENTKKGAELTKLKIKEVKPLQ